MVAKRFSNAKVPSHGSNWVTSVLAGNNSRLTLGVVELHNYSHLALRRIGPDLALLVAMKRITNLSVLSAIVLSATLTGCVADEAEGEDGIDDVGVASGKADGTAFSACELKAVVTMLNGGATLETIRNTGVSKRSATRIVQARDGGDKKFGTADDKLFADIQAVDAVPYVGAATIKALVDSISDSCATPADIFAEARDVNKLIVRFPAGTPAPANYAYPNGGGEFSLNGTEFWQKWEGGQNPTYSYSAGSEAGKLCMQASAIRFEAIMKNAPAELKKLNADSNWSGSFFNWNDDYVKSTRDGGQATLWAWRTSLIKWISTTHKDGSCELPTLEIVKRAATNCLATAARDGKEIQGCQD